MKIKVRIEGDIHDVELVENDGNWTAKVAGHEWSIASNAGATDVVRVGPDSFSVGAHGRDVIAVDGESVDFHILELAGVAGAEAATSGGYGPITAPMTGKVEEIMVAQGDAVEAGQVLFVLEAMKMRNQVKAQVAGIVGAVQVQPGTAVDPRTTILVLEPST